MITGGKVCENNRIILHVIFLIVHSKHRKWIFLSLFCFFASSIFFFFFFRYCCRLSTFCWFLSFSFSFFLLFLFFPHHFQGCWFKSWTWKRRGSTFSFGFSFLGILCLCGCFYSFVYSVMMSSVCADLLQVPGFTALAYVLAW